MNGGQQRLVRRGFAMIAAAAATATVMLLLDLAWLGFVARDFYDSMLGPLRRPDVFWPAAVLFYTLYVIAILVYAVAGSLDSMSSLRRGAALGLVAYATYELTNWAILRDWPPLLVVVDVGWGVILTAVSGFSGKLTHTNILDRAR